MSPKKQLDNASLSNFCRQLTMIFKSGIYLEEGFKAMEEQNSIEEIDYEAILSELKSNPNLSRALESTNLFPVELIEMVQAGEQVGRLDQVFDQLTHYYRRQDETEKTLRDTLFIPFLLLCIMIVVIGVLAFYVLPIFVSVYESLGTGLSPLTTIMMNLGKGIAIVGFTLLIVLFVFILFTYLKSIRHPEKSSSITSLFLSLSPKLKDTINLARFTFIAQLLLRGGIETRSALTQSAASLHDGKTAAKLREIVSELKPGEGLPELLSKGEIYPPLLRSTISLALKTGKLDEVMGEISLYYEDEVQRVTNRFINRLEPTFVFGLSFLVGALLLSLMLPLISIMSSLG